MSIPVGTLFHEENSRFLSNPPSFRSTISLPAIHSHSHFPSQESQQQQPQHHSSNHQGMISPPHDHSLSAMHRSFSSMSFVDSSMDPTRDPSYVSLPPVSVSLTLSLTLGGTSHVVNHKERALSAVLDPVFENSWHDARRKRLYTLTRGSNPLPMSRSVSSNGYYPPTKEFQSGSVVARLNNKLDYLRAHPEVLAKLPERRPARHQSPTSLSSLKRLTKSQDDSSCTFLTGMDADEVEERANRRRMVHDTIPLRMRTKMKKVSTTDRVRKVRDRHAVIMDEYMDHHREIVHRVECMAQIKAAKEQERLWQSKWLTLIPLLNFIPPLVDQMRKERLRKKMERAARHIQKLWRGYTVFRDQIRHHRALAVLSRFFYQYICRRRMRKTREAAHLVRIYLEDLRESNRILFVIKRYRRAVINVQRAYRAFRSQRRARLAILGLQFKNASEGIAARMTRHLKNLPSSEQLRGIVKRDEIIRIAPDIVEQVLLDDIRMRQHQFIVEWRDHLKQVKAWEERVEYERARALVSKTSSLAGERPRPPHFAVLLRHSRMEELVYVALGRMRERMKQRLIERGETIEAFNLDPEKDREREREREREKEAREKEAREKEREMRDRERDLLKGRDTNRSRTSTKSRNSSAPGSSSGPKRTGEVMIPIAVAAPVGGSKKS